MPTTANPLPQLIAPRLCKARERVGRAMWGAPRELPLLMGPLHEQRVELATAMGEPLVEVRPGTVIGPAGGWRSRWSRVDIPAPLPGEAGHRFLRWDVQGETTVYLDGEPWAGLDVAHRHCPLPDRACTLWCDTGLWLTGIWCPGAKPIDRHGPRHEGCALVVRDEAAWNAYWDIDCLLHLLSRLFAANPHPVGDPQGWAMYKPTHERAGVLMRKLLRAGDDAVDALDRGGIAAFAAALRGIYARFRNPEWTTTAAVTGMAHLDLVWLWPEAVTERKTIHSFATQVRLLERYPEFIFNQSQPVLNRVVERLEPALARSIAGRIAEGRWELTGGFDVECDNQLPCGESLARSLLLGQREFTRLRGRPSDLCWLPDVFGYSTALPQLLRLAGVGRFYTTKLSWSAVTRFPYTSFVWQGADGSEVLTHLCPTGYNLDLGTDQLLEAVEGHRQVDMHDEVLLCVGYSDGGGGPTEEMCERARRYADLAGLPKVAWTTGEAFFDRLATVRERLPRYQGELYLEWHRGTFTTQGEFKRLHRRAETAVQAHEAVRAVRGGGPLPEAVWRRLAFSQFHDAIPGSSIALVYEQLNPELAALGDAALTAAVDELGASGADDVTVFNPLAVARRVAVELPAGGAGWRVDGTVLPSQSTAAGLTLTLVDLPPLAAVTLRPAATATAPALTATPDLLDNGVVRARFTDDGRLVELTVAGRPLLLTDPAGFVLHHDLPAQCDAWDIDHYTRATGEPCAAMALAVVEHGPARVALRGSAPLGDGSRLTVDWRLDAGSRHLEAVVTVDWHERHRLLKFTVPTAYRGPSARFGAAFGSILRPQAPGDQADEAKWEVPGSRWAAVIDEDGAGLALLSEAKYGFSCRSGVLGLSLLRAPCYPDQDDGRSDAAGLTDQGTHVMRFAIGEHRASSADDAASTALAAETLFAPVVVAPGVASGLDASPFRFSDLGSLVPSWVLPATGGGTIVRLHEANGGRGTALLHLASPVDVVPVDLLERPFGSAADQPAAPVIERIDARTWRIAYVPYCIVSLRLR